MSYLSARLARCRRVETRVFARALVAVAGFLFASTPWSASNVIELGYDPAGNITSIQRQSAAGFAITSVDPGSGAMGATVTVYGTGFSATPANNTVKFNGTTATVSASTTGSISTTVPSGATTGRVTVTVGGATATSPQDFVIVVPGAPTISSVTPSRGASGTSVSITGTNFDVATNLVKLNGVTASATVASATSQSITVPASLLPAESRSPTRSERVPARRTSWCRPRVSTRTTSS